MPICNPSATNRIVPAGVPAPLVTVAVSVTGLPTGAVATDALMVTVVGESRAKAGVEANAEKITNRLAMMKGQLNARDRRLKEQRAA